MVHHTDVHGPPVIREMMGDLRFGPDQALVARLEDMLEFVGPFTNKVGETPYITLTQYGVKEEGQSIYPDEESRCWTAAEAMWRFRKTFIAHLEQNPAKQLAWRQKPTLETKPDGDFVVRCRFALLGTAETVLRAVA